MSRRWGWYVSVIVAQYLKALAKQLISESGLFAVNTEKWVQIVLRLSRAVCDNLTEETNESSEGILGMNTNRFGLETPIQQNSGYFCHILTISFRIEFSECWFVISITRWIFNWSAGDCRSQDFGSWCVRDWCQCDSSGRRYSRSKRVCWWFDDSEELSP